MNAEGWGRLFHRFGRLRVRTVLGVVISGLVLLMAGGFVQQGDASLGRGVSLTTVLPALGTLENSDVEFSDIFTGDSSLNTSAWDLNGPAANTSMDYFGYDRLSPVTPTLGFSADSGLSFSGVTDDYSYANVQSQASFTPPFTAQATVEATASNGTTIVLALGNSDGGEGIDIVGALNSSDPYYGMGVQHSIGSGESWAAGVYLDTQPALDTFYTLTLGVDSTGEGTATLAAGSTVIGSGSFSIGLGPFYLWLGQFVDAPPVTGENSASWLDVYLNSTPTIPPGPTIVGAVADPYSISLGAPTSFDVFVSGGALPLSVVYTALPPGCVSQSLLTLECTPSEAGNFTVLVTVTDSMDRVATAEINLSVRTVHTTGSAITPVSPIVYGAFALAAGALILAGTMVVMNRRRGGAPPAGSGSR